MSTAEHPSIPTWRETTIFGINAIGVTISVDRYEGGAGSILFTRRDSEEFALIEVDQLPLPIFNPLSVDYKEEIEAQAPGIYERLDCWRKNVATLAALSGVPSYDVARRETNITRWDGRK